MNNINYTNVMKDTIDETYPKYLQKRLIKKLEIDGLVFFEQNLLIEEDAVDLTAVEEESQLIHAITNNNEILRRIEKDEFLNSYKYAAIFDHSGLEKKDFSGLLARNIVNNFNEKADNTSDELFIDETDNISPTYYEVDENILILKFNRLLSGYKPVEGDNKRNIKYPILAVIYLDLDVIEIRFEKTKGFLKDNDEYFYIKQIDIIKNWIEENIGIELSPILLSPVIDYISKKESQDVNVSAQAMTLKTGKKAILDVGQNDDHFILPLLGELKELIKANQEIFDENHTIKELLDNFIIETEETSELPWISLTWNEETKDKTIQVKFNFNYMNKDYTVLQYYGNKNEMERMNNVTSYLIENKREFEEQD